MKEPRGFYCHWRHITNEFFLLDDLQLFSLFNTVIWSAHLDESHETNDSCSLTRFTFYLIFTRKHTLHTVILVASQMNGSNFFSSAIFLFRCRDPLFVVSTQLQEKWICIRGTLQLFNDFNANTGMCYLDQSHMTNDFVSFASIILSFSKANS
jgi:hypothetical protein